MVFSIADLRVKVTSALRVSLCTAFWLHSNLLRRHDLQASSVYRLPHQYQRVQGCCGGQNTNDGGKKEWLWLNSTKTAAYKNSQNKSYHRREMLEMLNIEKWKWGNEFHLILENDSKDSFIFNQTWTEQFSSIRDFVGDTDGHVYQILCNMKSLRLTAVDK